MPKLTVETIDAEKPILFIVGESHPLIKILIEQYQDKFKIAILSSSSKIIPEGSEIFRIDASNAALIKNLKERVDYAIVFCEDPKIKEYIGPVFEKFADDKTKTVILCSVDSFEDFDDVALATKQAPTFNFLIYGDIYSEDIDFNPDSPTTKLIDSALFNKEAIISGNDISPLFPIYLKDALIGISQVLFSPRKNRHYYLLFYDHPQTYISALHILERVEPDLNIIYKDTGLADRYESRTVLERAIEKKVDERPASQNDIYEGFEKSLKYFLKRGPVKEPEEKTTIFTLPVQKIKKKKSSITSFLKLTITALFLFVLIEVAAAAGSFLLLRKSVDDFRNGKFASASQNAKGAQTLLSVFKPGAEIITQVAASGGNKSLDSNFKLFATATNMAGIVAQDSDNLTKIKDGISKDLLEKSIADAVYLYFLGQKLKAETNNPNIAAYLTADMSDVLTLAQVAPQALGFEGEKNYLILFQNNGELRPTGGFIGTVGDIILKDGKIKDLTLQDVYAYDGQLKVHVEPHYVIRRNIQQHLYLRDSNFNPDFQSSAATAALIYKLETGKKVDGVIAVNFDAVKQIIGAIGPIELTTYKTTINSENTFDFLQKTIDSNFFPGSTQKRDVIQALFDKIMLKLEDRQNFMKVARLLPQFAEEKNILFAFNTDSTQNAFSAVGFGGEIKDSRQIENGKVADFLSANEANIGTNKANIKVTRSIDYTAAFNQTKVVSKISYNINNESSAKYKAYIRFFTPLGSKLTSLKIDGKTQQIVPAVTDYEVYEKRNFVVPQGLEVSDEIQNNQQVFGFITEVAPSSLQDIELIYDNGVTVPAQSIVDYSLLFIKQPGMQPIPFTLNLVYGSNFTPKEVEGAMLENGVIVMTKEINSDLELTAELLRR